MEEFINLDNKTGDKHSNAENSSASKHPRSQKYWAAEDGRASHQPEIRHHEGSYGETDSFKEQLQLHR